MPIQVETSPFAMFPAQADYSNTEWEKREALRALLPWADTADDLRNLAMTLGIIDPPTVEADTGPVLCVSGHDQAEHGVNRSDGRRACRECARLRALRKSGMVNSAGTVRRIRHLLLNGFTVRGLARLTGVSAGTISRLSLDQVQRVAPEAERSVRSLFDERRHEFHDTTPHWSHAETRKNWVWAELFEDIDDPACVPVIPAKRVAA